MLGKLQHSELQKCAWQFCSFVNSGHIQDLVDLGERISCTVFRLLKTGNFLITLARKATDIYDCVTQDSKTGHNFTLAFINQVI